MIKDPKILAAIVSVLDGNPSEEEQCIVNNWLSENEANKVAFENFSNTVYQQTIESEAYAAKEKTFLNIIQKIEDSTPRRAINIWKYIAAASIIVAVILAGTNLIKKDIPTMSIAQIQTKSPLGTTSKITLGDGTIVELNAGSELSYPSVFDKETRTVYLKGEAYFEVAKDEKHPFIVEANGIKIKVLGTHFNVRSYDDDENITTTLLEGKVSISKNQSDIKKENPIVLMPNQQLVFNKKNNSTNINEVEADLYVLWKEGQFYFQREKFSDIVKKLSRGFGENISIQSPEVGNMVFSGIFTRKESIDNILNAFKKHRDFDYKKDGNGITIFKRIYNP